VRQTRTDERVPLLADFFAKRPLMTAIGLQIPDKLLALADEVIE
jgi:hypothetical protein